MITSRVFLKTTVFTIFFHATLGIYATPENTKPKLCSTIIKWLDNKPFGLDSVAMGDVLHVRRELRKIQFGVQDPITKQPVGFYTFQGQKRTLRWLADYEHALEKEFIAQKTALEKKYLDYKEYSAEWELTKINLELEFEKKHYEIDEKIKRTVKDQEDWDYQCALAYKACSNEFEQSCIHKEEDIKNKYCNDKTAYQKEVRIITEQYKALCRELEPCVEDIKLDFVKANQPFSSTMEGTNLMLLKLVAEFCIKYKRPYSYLLEWASLDDGQGLESFEKNMVSCRALNTFITDLVDFFEALYISCDKARADYETKQKQKLQKK